MVTANLARIDFLVIKAPPLPSTVTKLIVFFKRLQLQKNKGQLACFILAMINEAC
ncbi:hypothetical protein LPAF129_17710 [Ligilactobacillus pabuli]|uniref:Uncharacterized protein n=1 Tax=Ligilactobacillus pabuli TaxID=2886039 RepID=A0ABQ5JJ67_9LACO|nr:hypothetical protein LPAF129_17710 [Ligilactobacillus pabuli]